MNSHLLPKEPDVGWKFPASGPSETGGDVPWIQALIWAFKPTDIVDIRHLLKDTARDTDAIIARLTGKAKADVAHEPERIG